MQVRRKPDYKILALLWAIAIATFTGCDVINPSDPVPSYVGVDTFSLTTQPTEGSASQKITEGWFYANNEFLGAYTLPASIPVIAEGITEIIVFPGVRLNGISTLPDIYPFYARYSIDLDLILTDTVWIEPTTTYLESTAFPMIENFETGNVFVDDLDGDPQTVMVPTTEEVFEGQRSGHIMLTSDHGYIEVASLPALENIPLNGQPVFLEMNYKNDIELAVGLVGQGPGVPQSKQILVILRPRGDWNKIYIDLTDLIIASGLPGYQVFFNASLGGLGPEAHIYVDNVKLVTFSP